MVAKKAASARASRFNGNVANLGFEAKLWLTADKLRNNMDAGEYNACSADLGFIISEFPGGGKSTAEVCG